MYTMTLLCDIQHDGLTYTYIVKGLQQIQLMFIFVYRYSKRKEKINSPCDENPQGKSHFYHLTQCLGISFFCVHKYIFSSTSILLVAKISMYLLSQSFTDRLSNLFPICHYYKQYCNEYVFTQACEPLGLSLLRSF